MRKVQVDQDENTLDNGVGRWTGGQVQWCLDKRQVDGSKERKWNPFLIVAVKIWTLKLGAPIFIYLFS